LSHLGRVTGLCTVEGQTDVGGTAVWWRRKERLADAREEALRWYERLGGQIANLPSGDEPAVKQAMIDAGERFNAAGAQLDRAQSVRQYELVQQTALEGLAYIRAARIAMRLDPGPDLPSLPGQARAGAITADREVDVQGRAYRASPRPAGDTPYYYPGGMVGGRGIPAGWYSEPWWKTALVAGAAGVGSMLLFDALLGGFSHDGYDQGFQEGLDWADQHGWDPGTDSGAADGGGDAAGGDAADGSDSYDASGDYGAGDYGGGDFGGF
jgi:hypothetical protein